mgnify:CR=1 FL=1
MRTAIVTDSNSGIFEEESRKMGVFVLPMPVMIDDRSYYEGQSLSHEQFFRYLYEHKPVSTAQPNVGDMLDLWKQVLESGYDELVYIPMSSRLSGSCQTAQGFASEYGGRVEVVDNRRVSVTQRHAVLDAIGLRKKGVCAKEIRKVLEDTAGDSVIYLGVSTLEYFRMNGRVTAAGAAVGTVLNLKPLLVARGGKFDAYAKIRGTMKCQRKLIEAMKAEADRLGADGGRLYIGAAGSFAEPEKTEAWAAMVKEAFPDREVNYDPLTFSVACHTGPDAFGMGISRAII